MASAKRPKPNSSHFQPGKSGNPAGRPPKKLNPTAPAVNADLILSEGARLVTVEQNGVATTIDMETLAVRALYAKAAKGDPRALKLVTEQNALAKKEKEDRYIRIMINGLNYKEWWTASIARAKKHGQRPPDIVPHPDDIIVDLQRIGISIRGPKNKTERDGRNKLHEMRADFRATLEWMDSHPKYGRDDPDHPAEVAHVRHLVAMIDGWLPEVEPWDDYLLYPLEG